MQPNFDQHEQGGHQCAERADRRADQRGADIIEVAPAKAPRDPERDEDQRQPDAEDGNGQHTVVFEACPEQQQTAVDERD